MNQKQTANNEYPAITYVLLPAIAMMLAWGFRGHIGGGPFGAMIPGAMIALSLCLLLKLPLAPTSVILVFGVFGIGLGGEMTYGQTLGFLRNPDTVWWGLVGTTTKGSIWGLLGGIVFSIGFIYNKIPHKKIIIGLIIMMTGMLLGFKLINEPMIIYFSDPAKPRAESWAALLFGAIALFTFLKFNIEKQEFRITARFALFGLIGGGLGFGLGSLWMVLGNNITNVIFKSWWKAMEFSFGFLLGGFMGYAAWLSRTKIKEIAALKQTYESISPNSLVKEIGTILLTTLITYWLIPYLLEPFVDAASRDDSFLLVVLRSIARILANYAFYGFLFVLFIHYIPKMAFQAGITLTFAHTAIDLVRDNLENLSIPYQVLIILFMILAVALITAFFSRKKFAPRNLFIVLIWSCLFVSFLKIPLNPGLLNFENLSLCQIICGRFIVDIFFTLSLILLTWILFTKIEST